MLRRKKNIIKLEGVNWPNIKEGEVLTFEIQIPAKPESAKAKELRNLQELSGALKLSVYLNFISVIFLSFVLIYITNC